MANGSDGEDSSFHYDARHLSDSGHPAVKVERSNIGSTAASSLPSAQSAHAVTTPGACCCLGSVDHAGRISCNAD